MWSPKLLRNLFCSAVCAVFIVSTGVAQQPPAGQTQQPPAEENPQPTPESGQTAEPAEPAENEGEEVQIPEPVPDEITEMTESSGYRYEARGRRDPFVSLALGLSVLPPDARPPGLSGMLIQEVSLHGIVQTSDGFVAMIQGTDNKSYFARVGERLYDGSIEEIDAGRVIFRQEINDPLRIEKFSRIEKSLHPVEEGK